MKDFLILIFSNNPLGINIILGAIFLLGALFIGGFVCFILYSIYSGIGFLTAKIQSETGKVTHKYYHGKSVHTGVGLTTGGQIAMTTSYEGAEYIIEYQSNEDGQKYRIRTDSEIYDALDIGDRVKAYFKVSTTTQEFKWTGGLKKYEQ